MDVGDDMTGAHNVHGGNGKLTAGGRMKSQALET
jgi:hypothetical protein